ncbi:hypothetical protein TSUD_142300 [Trifolium subterraneum]|uniref:Uncharacterized protein n=1 Tax=Trifolium subterraneum TaxID=3900 RepID=A0A2Z6MHG5_TRISU|nr:hypothetical protein TSUD_142300 [Trifolium subterraneum]
MVLLRELDDAKDYPAVIHLVGSDWERQVRAHYTRADITLNINGYYSEMFGFTIKSSDFESGSSDSDSDSSEQEPHYFYMVMNVAPCQLHPNSWAFLKAFQVACEGLDLVPTAGVFFCFFHVKNVSPHSLISISSQPNKGRFSLYASNFKNYKDAFVRFRCGERFPELMFDASRNRLFPFYWSSSPRLIKGTRTSTLNEYERLAVSALSKFQLLSSVELISREDKPQPLGEYMGSMSTISAQQRAALVMKARAQKAEEERAAASADAMSQLVVEESGVKNTKRKNSEGSGRIPTKIPKKMKGLGLYFLYPHEIGMGLGKPELYGFGDGKIRPRPAPLPCLMKVTVVGEEEDEDDDEPLKPRRSKGRGLTSLGSGEGGSSAATKGKEASISSCPLNPEVKKGRKSNLSPSLFTKDLDSFDVVNYGFQKYARTSSLSDLPFEDLRQAALDHHVQGVMLTYYLSNRQEHESIDFRNKMESADTSLSALEKEFAAAKSKFAEDLAAVKAEQEEKVKAAVKAKEDEVMALKGKLATVEGELTEEKAKAKTQQEEASLNVEALIGRIEKLEVEGASQFDEGFKFALEQVKVAFPDVDAVKLGELDSVSQIVEGKIVPYVFPPSE